MEFTLFCSVGMDSSNGMCTGITVFSGEAGYRQRPSAKFFAQVIDVFHNLCLSKFPSFFTYKVYSIPVHIPWTLFQATASTSLPIWSSYSRQNGLEWPLHPVILISHPKPLKKYIYIYVYIYIYISRVRRWLKERKSEQESLIKLEDRWVKALKK